MAKAIFATRVGSGYDDRPEERYHFPQTYLNQVEAAVGDHVIYYEPRRTGTDGTAGGRQAYFATARVAAVRPDETRPGLHYAAIVDFLSFDKPVPFSEGGHYYEAALRKSDGTTNRGAFGRAVRLIPDSEFERILRGGFALEIETEQAPRGLFGELSDLPQATIRPMIELTISKPFRDRAFQKIVREAYGNRCALTGIRLINGGGRPEVQAAHIMPVAREGPDSVRNGLALSGTIHWMFDRGLISVDENYKILASERNVPPQVMQLLNAHRSVSLPAEPAFQPHQHYLRFHRENIFKG